MGSKNRLPALYAVIFIFGTATAPVASAAPPDDACALLTDTQVDAVLGVSVSAGSHPTPTSLKLCSWAEANAPMMGRKSVRVALKTAADFEGMKKLRAQAKAMAEQEKDEDAGQMSLTPASGIGDEAYFTPTLWVKKGNVAFELFITGLDLPTDQVRVKLKTLALQILSKL
jgi:hypothetical protein